jgi:hypothetical protein
MNGTVNFPRDIVRRLLTMTRMGAVRLRREVVIRLPLNLPPLWLAPI